MPNRNAPNGHAFKFTAKKRNDGKFANVSVSELDKAQRILASHKARMVAGPAVEALGQVVGGLQIFVALNEEGGPLTNAPQQIKDTNTEVIKLVKRMVDQLNEAVGNIPRAEGAEPDKAKPQAQPPQSTAPKPAGTPKVKQEK